MKKRSIFWKKGLCVLLGVLFFFTIASRIADSLTVARVSTVGPSARKLQYTVSVEGSVQSRREMAVLTESDLLIKSVFVSKGQQVKKGDVLTKIDLRQLDEQIEQAAGEKKTLELQNQALRNNQARGKNTQKKQSAYAKEDYRLLKAANKAVLKRAKKALATAEKRLQAEQERQAKKAEKKTQTPAAVSMSAIEKQEKEQAEEQEAEQAQATLEALQDAVTERKNAYEELQASTRDAERKARREMETEGQETDNSILVNEIEIRKIGRRLEKLRDIKREKGKILAPEGGVITELLVGVGQKTSDTAIITMTDDRAGFQFVGQLAEEDASQIAVGMPVTLRKGTEERDGIAVTSIEPDERDESGKSMNVTAFLPKDSFSLGESITMSMTKESENYSCTVPLSAIHEEAGKYFVLLVQTEDTVLGSQETAERAEVKVLEKNESYAALEEGTLSEDSRIITDSSRYVASGDRVRLEG